MKKLLLFLLFSVPFISYAQQYDMSYLTFAKYIKEEMTDKEFKSIDEFFGGNFSGIICFYEYGDFSGDGADEFVVITYEQNPDIDVYVFQGTDNETFEFVKKLSYRYWKSRYEVAILIKRGTLYVTSTDPKYEKWTWNNFKLQNGKLNLVKNDIYQ
ncbi:MAG: hypothetical protein EHM58_19925 [Ignavibacteriae bacterium]|nr:MAG: hypothetical protein EHM58_19925 [Ignavibacteriota bacterium]